MFSTRLALFSQKYIIIRYVDVTIETPVRVPGYIFSEWDFNEIEIADTLSYNFIKESIDKITFCHDSFTCPFPDVRQQIVVIDGEKYDILSSDGSFSMEKNGRSVYFDEKLQQKINDIIRFHEKQKK
jgi:hypothetical protein